MKPNSAAKSVRIRPIPTADHVKNIESDMQENLYDAEKLQDPLQDSRNLHNMLNRNVDSGPIGRTRQPLKNQGMFIFPITTDSIVDFSNTIALISCRLDVLHRCDHISNNAQTLVPTTSQIHVRIQITLF
jgi:hypothetical protein